MDGVGEVRARDASSAHGSAKRTAHRRRHVGRKAQCRLRWDARPARALRHGRGRAKPRLTRDVIRHDDAATHKISRLTSRTKLQQYHNHGHGRCPPAWKTLSASFTLLLGPSKVVRRATLREMCATSSTPWPVWASLFANAVLFTAKLACFLLTGSLAVAASLVDSTIDLIAQGVMALASRSSASRADPNYPVGKARLEAVSVILVAALFAMGAGEVVQQCARRLALGDARNVELTASTLALLVAVVCVKLALFVACWRHRATSSTVHALAFDHVSDVASNTVALLAVSASGTRLGRHLVGPSRAWTLDPAGGLLISLAIFFGWGAITWDHVTKLVGRHASSDLVRRVEALVDAHHPLLTRDACRCYHAGEKILVELEVVMPPETTVRMSHDVCLRLQDAVEAMEEVERAFVHVDYASRRAPEHRADRGRGDHRRLGSDVSLLCGEGEEPAFDTVDVARSTTMV